MSTLRIAFLVDKCAPFFVGGYEDRFWNLARFLASNHEVRVYTSLAQPSIQLSGVSFKRLIGGVDTSSDSRSRSRLRDLAFAGALLTDPTKEWNPDVLVVEAIPYLHLLTMRRWASKVRALKILNVNEAWVGYSLYPNPLGVAATKAVRRLLSIGLDWADVAMPISRVTADSLSSSFSPKQLLIVPMGFDRPDQSKSVAQGLQEKKFDFVWLGRLVPIKRPYDFLRAISNLRSRGRWKGRAALIGDGPLLTELRQERNNLGLGEVVEIPGRVTNEERNVILRSSRVFVLTSEREGFSLSTLEALSFGLPAVVARPREPEVFGVSQIVTDGEDGRYYTIGSVEELADELDSLERDPAMLDRLSKAAAAQSEQYRWGEITKQFETSLLKLTADR